ncbi:epidermal growth factor receptor kinase substrate 8-like protein 3 [Perca flavescens]|uniref:epidermal growth factor receptor kinase substrate 8-like protein 3 n=1 Tax=Perca flavescens TaxID=8167 RepID=UPI00106DEA93|nr:epidermal growth factor receptor kinase substrate 8-like protein 3 [Perca flavescens]
MLKMFRRNSPFGNDTSSYTGSIQSNGYSTMDEVSSQVSSQSKPSAKSIYLQRMEYAVSINKMMDKFQYRVEHLFTCDLNGKELRSVADCVERLKLLDGMGRVWGQNMLLEVRGANLLLTDMETKEELESMAFSDILELKAVLDTGVFKSLLTVSVQSGEKHTPTVFMFQCEDVRADYVQRDLSGAMSRRSNDLSISNAGLIAGHRGMKNLCDAAESSEPKEPEPAVDPVPQWMAPDYVMDGMPPAAEFEVCLHKIKCGFNLVVVSHCPEDLPPTIVAPLLTPQCIRLLSEEASAEQDQLWQSLGDAWNIPSTKWPEDDEDIPTYTLEFLDGWQPPEVTAAPEPREPIRRQAPQQPAPSQASAKWTPPPHPPKKTRSGESKLRHIQVTNDFISRNHRELTVRKGELVELLDMSKQWWKVRNSRGEEGFVPNNVLEARVDEQPIEETGGSPVLTKKSKPAEVKAWLTDKGLSKITVRCLGVLSGSMLLGMTRDELKTMCPEEGGRVFSQLQAVKSAMAVGI